MYFSYIRIISTPKPIRLLISLREQEFLEEKQNYRARDRADYSPSAWLEALSVSLLASSFASSLRGLLKGRVKIVASEIVWNVIPYILLNTHCTEYLFFCPSM
jgi:hypothetical protein